MSQKSKKKAKKAKKAKLPVSSSESDSDFDFDEDSQSLLDQRYEDLGTQERSKIRAFKSFYVGLVFETA